MLLPAAIDALRSPVAIVTVFLSGSTCSIGPVLSYSTGHRSNKLLQGLFTKVAGKILHEIQYIAEQASIAAAKSTGSIFRQARHFEDLTMFIRHSDTSCCIKDLNHRAWLNMKTLLLSFNKRGGRPTFATMKYRP